MRPHFPRNGALVSAGGNIERSRGRDDYETPPWFFRLLDLEFQFGVDAAADESNHLCPIWFGPDGRYPDALAAPWLGHWNAWCNPPFGDMAAFMAHIVEQEATVALLGPLAPDRNWYKLGVRHATEVRQLTHRLDFLLAGKPVVDKDGKRVGNTIGSALFVFRRHAPDRGGAHIWMWDARADAKRKGLL